MKKNSFLQVCEMCDHFKIRCFKVKSGSLLVNKSHDNNLINGCHNNNGSLVKENGKNN